MHGGVFQWRQHLAADESPAPKRQDQGQAQHDDRGGFGLQVAPVRGVIDLDGATLGVVQDGADPLFELRIGGTGLRHGVHVVVGGLLLQRFPQGVDAAHVGVEHAVQVRRHFPGGVRQFGHPLKDGIALTRVAQKLGGLVHAGLRLGRAAGLHVKVGGHERDAGAQQQHLGLVKRAGLLRGHQVQVVDGVIGRLGKRPAHGGGARQGQDKESQDGEQSSSNFQVLKHARGSCKGCRPSAGRRDLVINPRQM
ncbi:hypothetical protein D3C73_819430 [compost metagenome]